MSDDSVGFNGIDLETGQPILDPLSDEELGEILLGLDDRAWRNRREERELEVRHENFTSPKFERRPAADIDPLSLASSGWGVIFPRDVPPETRENLKPLLDHRREQASRWNSKYFRDDLVYEPGDTEQRFTNRHGVKTGPVDPANGLPYYLMIVGSPTEIPHEFQYLLDVQFGVGRLHFEDPEDYGRYAQSVIDAERGQHRIRPEMTLFSVAGDKTTRIMASCFVDALYRGLQSARPEWTFRNIVNGTKESLRRILGGPETPALLLTAAHGLACKKDHRRQRDCQGAILCQDWPWASQPDPEHYFSATDLDDQARVHGSIVFLFGCYSAGTPRVTNFPEVAKRAMSNRAHDPNLASEPFISALAQRLLAHPKGSALAVLGHVDRAWTRSFGGSTGDGFTHIESLFKNLLDGHPVGSGMDWMHERFAEQSTKLTNIMNPRGERQEPKTAEVARLWRANNDARNFVVLGDPAVRLAAGPRAAFSGMSLLYDRAPESRRPLKRVNWRQLFGRWETEPVNGLDLVEAVRRIRSPR